MTMKNSVVVVIVVVVVVVHTSNVFLLSSITFGSNLLKKFFAGNAGSPHPLGAILSSAFLNV